VYRFIYILLLSFLNSAYQAQTAYFQQIVDFNIQVQLDDKNHNLRGKETIAYTNHSPTALTYIYMHLWPNAYKSNHSFLAKQLYTVNRNPVMQKINPESSGFIDSLDFTVNGQKVRWEYCSGDSIDIARIYLNAPIETNGTITISTPFFVQIPDGGVSRFGHDFQQYHISQWYPKPAVYDQNGWHQMPYLENGEFYNDFGTYDVYITLPKNYVVGATGNLQSNLEEEAFIKNRIASTQKKSDFSNTSFPLSDPETKTLHFREDKITDFAWFCDKRYNVDVKEITMPVSNKKVKCLALYTDEEHRFWRNATGFMEDAMQKLSLWQGEYPFDQFTAVEGINNASGSMEYPTVAIISSQSSSQDLDIVLLHEIAHTWFPLTFGSNERASPWLDEGFVSALELRYAEMKYPEYNFLSSLNLNFTNDEKIRNRKGEEKKKKQSRYGFTYSYNYSAIQAKRNNSHQAINTMSELFTEDNYANMAYYESAILFRHLREVLGNDVYDDCFIKLFEQYKFTHVPLALLHQVFQQVSGKDLTWFFSDLLNGRKQIDYAFKSIEKIRNEYVLQIRNNSGVKAPLIVDALNANNDVITSTIIPGFSKDTTIKMPFVLSITNFAIDHQYLQRYVGKIIIYAQMVYLSDWSLLASCLFLF
jgi:hypothetical protein